MMTGTQASVLVLLLLVTNVLSAIRTMNLQDGVARHVAEFAVQQINVDSPDNAYRLTSIIGGTEDASEEGTTYDLVIVVEETQCSPYDGKNINDPKQCPGNFQITCTIQVFYAVSDGSEDIELLDQTCFA